MGKSKEFEAMKGRFKNQTTEELREITQRGGMNSGKSRREQKRIKDALQDIIAEKVTTTSGDDVTRAYYIASVLANKAAKGDLKAIEILLKHLEGSGSEVNVNVEDKAVTFRWVDA